jgi:hypothetical protein
VAAVAWKPLFLAATFLGSAPNTLEKYPEIVAVPSEEYPAIFEKRHGTASPHRPAMVY